MTRARWRWSSFTVQGGAVHALDFSRDGKFLAVARSTKGAAPCIEVYSTSDGSLAGQFAQGMFECGGVAITASHVYFAAASVQYAQSFQVYKQALDDPQATPQTLFTAKYGMHSLQGIRKNRWETHFALCAKNFEIFTADGVRSLELPGIGSYRGVTACFDPWLSTVHVGSVERGLIVTYDYLTGKCIETNPAAYDSCSEVHTNGSGRYLVSMGENHYGALVWDRLKQRSLCTSEIERKQHGHAAVLMNDGRTLVHCHYRLTVLARWTRSDAPRK